MSDKEQEENPSCSAPVQGDRSSPTQTTIMVVDDDEAVRTLLLEALKRHGYTVIAVATLEDAEANLQRLGPDVIGLVVTDIHLTSDPQGQEGYTLYQRWGNVRPRLHFLLISGNPDTHALPAIQSGAVPFLPKPFTLAKLLEVVRTLLDG